MKTDTPQKLVTLLAACVTMFYIIANEIGNMSFILMVKIGVYLLLAMVLFNLMFTIAVLKEPQERKP